MCAEQLIRELSEDETNRLSSQREFVVSHYDVGHEHRYESVEGKLHLIDVIIKNNWIEKHETYKLQCLGISFGDALAQELKMKWVTIEDEYGSDPALILEGTSIKLFPLTMISKRVERGDLVEVIELFGMTCSNIRQLLNAGA